MLSKFEPIEPLRAFRTVPGHPEYESDLPALAEMLLDERFRDAGAFLASECIIRPAGMLAADAPVVRLAITATVVHATQAWEKMRARAIGRGALVEPAEATTTETGTITLPGLAQGGDE